MYVHGYARVQTYLCMCVCGYVCYAQTCYVVMCIRVCMRDYVHTCALRRAGLRYVVTWLRGYVVTRAGLR